MADNDLINDELERVYRLYGERTRQFRRGLYGLIVAGLAVFLLIVVPFLTFRDQLAETQARERELAVELQKASARVAETEGSIEEMRAISQAAFEFQERSDSWERHQAMLEEAAAHAEELAELRRSFADWNDERLAAWVSGEAKQPPDDFVSTNRQLFGLSQRSCYWEGGIEHVTCRLCESFTREAEGTSQRIWGLAGVEDALLTAARDDLAAQVERACAWLTGGAPHWQLGEPFPLDRGDELRGWFSHDVRAYVERIDALDDSIRDSLPERKLAVARIRRKQANTTERLSVLEQQLDRVASFDRLGTPIGDLPVGLGQIVLLFPVVLALAFLVVANGYARLADLQRAFVRLCRKRDSSGEVMDEAHIAAIAPLWLDPREALGARLVKWAIMLTPLALILANLLLIVTTDALTEQLPDDAVISPAAYILLYAASVALALGALWYVWRSGAPPAEAAPS
jgi:hypothetical protein